MNSGRYSLGEYVVDPHRGSWFHGGHMVQSSCVTSYRGVEQILDRALIQSGEQDRSMGMTLVSAPTENRRNPPSPMPAADRSVPALGSRSMSPRRVPTLISPDATDGDLVGAIRERNPDALAEIFRRYGAAVYGVSRRVLADDALAEDITQDVFLRLWSESHRFDEQRGTLRSFLQRQAHSRSVERVRSEEARRRREDRSLALDVDPVENLESQVIAAIESDRIRQALLSLDADDRRAIVLAYYGGSSYREVATRLGLPEGTVKSRIRAGLRRLSSMLGEGGLEAER